VIKTRQGASLIYETTRNAIVFRNQDENGNIAPEETKAYNARAEAIEEYKMNTSSKSNSVESPDMSQASFGGIANGMGMDTGQD